MYCTCTASIHLCTSLYLEHLVACDAQLWNIENDLLIGAVTDSATVNDTLAIEKYVSPMAKALLELCIKK